MTVEQVDEIRDNRDCVSCETSVLLLTDDWYTLTAAQRSAAPPPSATPSREQIVDAAFDVIGGRYIHGAEQCAERVADAVVALFARPAAPVVGDEELAVLDAAAAYRGSIAESERTYEVWIATAERWGAGHPTTYQAHDAYTAAMTVRGQAKDLLDAAARAVRTALDPQERT